MYKIPLSEIDSLQNESQKIFSPIEMINSTNGSSNDSSFYHNIADAIEKEPQFLPNIRFESRNINKLKEIHDFPLIKYENTNVQPVPMKILSPMTSNDFIKTLTPITSLNSNNVSKKVNIVGIEQFMSTNEVMEFDKFYFTKPKNNHFTKENIKPQVNTKKFSIPIVKPKKKILSSEEIQMEKIKKEIENIKLLKQKNERNFEKNKFTISPSISTVSVYPSNNCLINDKSNSNLLCKKRDEKENLLNQKEFNLNIGNKNKSNCFNKKVLLKNKLKKNRSRSPCIIDEDVNDLSCKLESVSLNNRPNSRSKTPQKNYSRENIPSPIRFKLHSSNIRNHFKNNNSAVNLSKVTPIKTSVFNTNSNDTSLTSKFENIIVNTRKEKEKIDKLERENTKKDFNMKLTKKYYYKDKIKLSKLNN